MTPVLTKSYPTTAGVRGNRIVKLAAGMAAECTGVTDGGIGIADAMGAPAGGMLDVHQAGIAEVRAGAAFATGAQLTSDNQGRAVALPAPAGAAVRVRVVGIAMQEATAADDIVSVLVLPSETYVPAA